MSQYTFLLHLAYSSRGCLAFSWTEFYFCFNKILPAAVIELYFRFPFFHAAKDGMWWRWCYCIAYMRLTTHISAHTIPPKIAPQTNRINCCLSVQCTHTHNGIACRARNVFQIEIYVYTMYTKQNRMHHRNHALLSLLDCLPHTVRLRKKWFNKTRFYYVTRLALHRTPSLYIYLSPWIFFY